MVLHAADGRCYEPGTRGPCEEGSEFTFSSSGGRGRGLADPACKPRSVVKRMFDMAPESESSLQRLRGGSAAADAVAGSLGAAPPKTTRQGGGGSSGGRGKKDGGASSSSSSSSSALESALRRSREEREREERAREYLKFLISFMDGRPTV